LHKAVGLVPVAFVGELRGMVSAPLTSGSMRSISASPRAIGHWVIAVQIARRPVHQEC